MLFWLRENEGLNMRRGEITVDAIVRKISGSKRHREADFEIRGSRYHTNPHLKGGEAAITLEEDLTVAIYNGRRAGSKHVYLSVSSPRYKVEKRKY